METLKIVMDATVCFCSFVTMIPIAAHAGVYHARKRLRHRKPLNFYHRTSLGIAEFFGFEGDPD